MKSTSKKAIICVDDEKTVLDSLKEQLKGLFGRKYILEMAESGDEALEIIEELIEDEIEVLLIVSDWLMPGLKGDEFLIKVHQKYPIIVKVLLTGQADEAAIERARRSANLHRCLSKPWSEAELFKTVTSAMG